MAEFTVEGFSELEKNLKKLSVAAGRGVLRRSLKKAVEPAAEYAKTLAPVDEGALRDSITVSGKLDKRQASQHRKMFKDDRASVEMFMGPSYDLGAGGRHGHLLEFGTAHSQPHPFMRPAWDAQARPTLDRLGKIMWEEFEKSLMRSKGK